MNFVLFARFYLYNTTEFAQLCFINISYPLLYDGTSPYSNDLFTKFQWRSIGCVWSHSLNFKPQAYLVLYRDALKFGWADLLRLAEEPNGKLIGWQEVRDRKKEKKRKEQKK